MDLTGVTIAFDLDGTLVDTAPDLIGSLNVVLGERGLPHLPTEAARVLVGRGARALIERGFAVAGEPLAEAEVASLVARFIAVYRGRIAHESRAFERLEVALDALRARGAVLAVCTNKPTDLSELLLTALSLRDRFAAVVGADKASAPKPAAAHLLETIALAGGDPRRAIMVGDSIADVRSAQAAGVPCIVVPFGYTDTPAHELGGDLLVEHYDALGAAVEQLLSGAAPALPSRDGSAIAAASRADA